MARTRKSIQPLNLHKYDVLIEDRGTRSDYFKISQFDGYFYGGRNAFLIAGTTVLKPGSSILVEILNVNGETVYSAPVSNFVEGNSRLVQIEVYSDTPIGPGKLVVLGNANSYLDGTPVPSEWSDKYNVRWITDVVISPLINNNTPIRFVNPPTVTVQEKFYPVAATASFSQSVLVEFGDYELTPIQYNTVHNGYLIKLKNPNANNVFASEQLDGFFETFTTLQSSSEFIFTKIPITKIFNNRLVESRGKLITSSLGTVITDMEVSGAGFDYPTKIDPYGEVMVASSINRLRYNKLVEFTDDVTNTSFAKLRISNLNTVSGEINKIRVSYKVTTEPGDFITLSDSFTQVEELLAVDSGSKIVNLGQFNKIAISDYWYAATSSLAKNEIDPILPTYYFSSSVSTSLQPSQSSNLLVDAIFIKHEIENFTYKNYTSYFIGTNNATQISLLPNSEYTLKLNALFTNVSESIILDQSDSSVEIYLVKTENSDGTLLETNPRGQLLGTLTPSSTIQLFENTEFNFKPKITESGTFGLRFVVYGGFWNFSNVSVKGAQERFFSPDEVTLLVPITNTSNKLLTFKTEYLDTNNNSTNVSTLSTPIYFTGSQAASSASYALTASYALNGGTGGGNVSSSYPFAISGSTIYSTDTTKTNFSPDYGIIIGNNAGDNSGTEPPYAGVYVGSGSVLIGTNAGSSSIGLDTSVFIGADAGAISSYAFQSTFIGLRAGYSSSEVYEAVAIGKNAAANSDLAGQAVVIGYNAGRNTYQNFESVNIGRASGKNSTGSYQSVFIGSSTGEGAQSSDNSTFLGNGAGYLATGSFYSQMIGANAGFRATSSFSTFIGTNVGGRLSGSNNIIIGNSIGLPNGTSNAVNIGGFLFGTGSYFDPYVFDYNIFTGSVGNGRLGINVVQPQHALHVSGSTVFDASVLETATVTATAATGTVNFDTIKQSVLYYTTNAAANWTLNIRGNSATSLNSMLNVGQSITVVFLVTNGSPAYYPTAHTIDGSAVTPKWQGGSAPTAGNANAIDAYAYSIIKTANATFTVLASQTIFS